MDDLQSDISESSELTYKRLPDSVFFWTAILLHASVILVAASFNDITAVIDFIGSVGGSLIMFIFPGLGYLFALYKYGTRREREGCSTISYKGMAVFFLLLGLSFIYLYIFSLIVGGKEDS